MFNRTPNPISLLGANNTQNSQGLSSSLFNNPAPSRPGQQPVLPTNTLNLSGPSSNYLRNPNPFLASTQAPQQASFGAPVSLLQTSVDQKPGALPAASKTAYFDSLLEQSLKTKNKKKGVPSNTSALSDLPGLQLGLSDISKRVRELGGNNAIQKDKPIDSKAHYLLAGSGVAPDTSFQNLQSFKDQLSQGAPPPPPSIGIDIDSYLSQKQSQSTLSLIAEGLNRSARDFDAFLEEHVTMEWEEQRQRIYEHFGLSKPKSDDPQSLNISATGGFGRSSKREPTKEPDASSRSILGNTSVFGSSSMKKSVIGASAPIGSRGANLFADIIDKGITTQGGASSAPRDRFMIEKQSKYARAVQELNWARIEGRTLPLLKVFAEVGEGGGSDSNNRMIVDAYKALIEIVKESEAPKERSFAAQYLDESANSASILEVRAGIISGSRTYLEKQFYTQLEALVHKSPKESRPTGVPSALNMVRAYVRLRASRRDLVPENMEMQKLNDDFIWPLIYFLIRSGFVQEAAEYVTENHFAFRAIDRNFVTYLLDYQNSTDRRLSRGLQERINSDFSQRLNTGTNDPFKVACYKVVGRCDIRSRNLEGVSQTVEDWIWLHFVMAREVNRANEVAGEVFTLEDVRNVIRELGPLHFSTGQDSAPGFGTYFFMQILAGMFEQAVAYLYGFQYVEAVHFAIALDYYGLLRVSDPSSSGTELREFMPSFPYDTPDLLIRLKVKYDSKELPQISFGRMVGYYTRDFRAANVEAAVDYLTLICLNADLPGASGEAQASLCHEALREIVLESREFARLLGDIRSDGERIKGAIERRLKLLKLADQKHFLRTVTIQAASVADENGRATDAVLLFHLAEDYDNVICIINRALSEAVSIDLGQEQLKLQPLKPRTGSGKERAIDPESSLSLTCVDDPRILALNMTTLYNSNAVYFSKIKPANLEVCGILLHMSDGKTKVQAGKWAEALVTISNLNILPLRASGNASIIRASASAFADLPPVLARNISPLLIWTLTCCAQQREALRSSAFEDRTRKALADSLVTQAKDLMVFAGLIRFRLSEDVFETLARAGREVEGW
ncbi:MAG: hypothetical protein M1829_004576 [Trizodia sp. TS-e1964]|nr:MAG: hypothetical protein M1829_004576 [Trizodia sp. TS-e1964]